MTAFRKTGQTLDALLNGTPVLLGTIVSAGATINNHTTATPFSNTGDALGGLVLLIEATAAGYWIPVATNAGTVTTANGVRIEANGLAKVSIDPSMPFLAFIPASGAGNLKVFQLR